MSIPVIGTAIVSNPYWLHRLIMSVDYPVDDFIVINNNGRGQIDKELDELTKITHKWINNIKVCHMPANIGVAGAWNLIIKCYMNATYWVISNDDVAFCPGLLEEIATLMNADDDLGMINPNKGDFDLGAWDLFVIRDKIIQLFGLFDENTYPAYNEDADYIMRMRHRPIKRIVGTHHQYYHGKQLCDQYYNSGSQTQASEPHLKEMLADVNRKNIDYLTEKWGPDWRICNPYVNPYNCDRKPINLTNYDLEFVRSKNLGF